MSKIESTTLYFNLPFEMMAPFYIQNGHNASYEDLKNNWKAVESASLAEMGELRFGVAATFQTAESATLARLSFGDYEFPLLSDEEYEKRRASAFINAGNTLSLMATAMNLVNNCYIRSDTRVMGQPSKPNGDVE